MTTKSSASPLSSPLRPLLPTAAFSGPPRRDERGDGDGAGLEAKGAIPPPPTCGAEELCSDDRATRGFGDSRPLAAVGGANSARRALLSSWCCDWLPALVGESLPLLLADEKGRKLIFF